MAETEGWDYRNFNPTGRNVYFFRDTNHDYSQIQRKILAQASKKIKSGTISDILVEGDTGKLSFNFLDTHIKKYGLSALDPAVYLGYIFKDRLRDNSFRLYGIEYTKAQEEQSKLIGKMIRLRQNIKKGNANKELVLEYFKLQDIFESISEERSKFAVLETLTIMDEFSINQVGIIFGEAHFRDMVGLFKRFGVGFASYYPGKKRVTEEEAMAYAKKISD
jgi:hypothetical protein